MLLRNLFEAANSEVAIIFGRFNPPHQGHKAAWNTASKFNEWYVGTNQSTQGPKDPLPFNVKIDAMKTIMPEIEGHLVAEQSWFTLASMVYKKHGAVTLHVVTDENDSKIFVPALQKSNGKEGPHGYYKFKDIVWEPAARISSATDLRAAVAADDRKAFERAAGVSADTPVSGHPFFDVVKHYLTPYLDQAAAKEAEKANKEKLKAEKEKAKVAKKTKEPVPVEGVSELFDPGKDWKWSFKGSEEAVAVFKIGEIPYQFHAYTYSEDPAVWDVEFKNASRNAEQGRTSKFGLTGTGNSAEVMSTIADIMRAFLKEYQGKIKELTFTADEDSRRALYARMTKRLLPTWNLTQDGKEFKLSAPTKQGVAEGAPIVVMPRADRLKKAEPTKVRYQGDIVPDTKPPSTEKRGVKGRPGQRPMPKHESAAMAQTARRLTDPKDGKVAKLRAAGDKRREDNLKYRDIAKRNESVDLKTSLQELSNDMLGRYKKAAGADASKADKAGDFKRGDKRFKGINKATMKQFDNDSKGKE